MSDCTGPIGATPLTRTCPDGEQPDWEALEDIYGSAVEWGQACEACSDAADRGADLLGGMRRDEA